MNSKMRIYHRGYHSIFCYFLYFIQAAQLWLLTPLPLVGSSMFPWEVLHDAFSSKFPSFLLLQIPQTYHTSDSICMFCLYTTPSVSIFSHQLCQCPCTASHWASLTQIQGPTRAREIGGNPHWDSSHIVLESDVIHLLPCWLPVFLTLWMPACCTNSGFLCLFNPGGITHPTPKARKASLAHGG